MKKKYFSPEFDLTRLRFDDLMTDQDLSDPDDPKVSGDDNDDTY